MVTKKHAFILDKVIFNVQSGNLEAAAYFFFIFIYTKISNDIFSCFRNHLFDCLFTQMHNRSREYLCQVEEEVKWDVKCLLLQSNFQVFPGTLIKQNWLGVVNQRDTVLFPREQSSGFPKLLAFLKQIPKETPRLSWEVHKPDTYTSRPLSKRLTPETDT